MVRGESMLELLAHIMSVLKDAFAVVDVAKLRYGHQKRTMSVALFMLYIRLTEIIETGGATVAKLEADLRNHEGSQSFVTGRVEPFFVGQPFVEDVGRQRLNLCRFLAALDELAPALNAVDGFQYFNLIRHGLGKLNLLDVLLRVLQSGRLPLHVPSVQEWIPRWTPKTGH